ncbi:MAG TPA: hypothetical protein DCG68_00445 [Cryomorphaceae bacterium]|nr:hypothetical protein [Cryomorphaceae bacterium]
MNVRSKSDLPILADFTSGHGTPLVVNQATGRGYVLLDDGTIAPLNNRWVDVADYASFEAAVTAIGSTVTTLLIGTSQSVTSNVTVPSTLTLWFIGSGQLNVASTKTVTINGPIVTDIRQIFAGSGTIAGLGKMPVIYPDFWATNTTPGTTDMSTAIETAAAVLQSGNGGTIAFTGTTYLVQDLNLDDLTNGIVFLGTGGQSTDPGASTLLFTAGSGSLLSGNSSYGLSFKHLKFKYTNAAYAGELITFEHSAAAIDPSYIRFEECTVHGTSSAKLANSLIRMEKTIISTIKNCFFQWGAVGVRLGDNTYANAITLEGNTFLNLGTNHIYQGGNNLNVQINGNTFEALEDGTGDAIAQDFTKTVRGVRIAGNYFGDVTTSGGLGQIRIAGTGIEITGNFLNNVAVAAGDANIVLGAGSKGVTIRGNYCTADIGVSIPSATVTGLAIIGNDLSGVTTPISGTANVVAYSAIGNAGLNSLYDGAGAGKILDADSTYTRIYTPESVAAVTSGDSGDANTYYDNTGHVFRGAGGSGGSYLESEEIADPAAPSSNKGRLYFKDNGAGKTQLAVRFPTGATQVIATEP